MCIIKHKLHIWHENNGQQSNQSNNYRKLCTEIQVEARFFMSMSSLDSAEVLLLFHLQCDFSSCAFSSRSSWGKAAVQRSPTLSRPKVGVKQQCFICPHTRGSRVVSRIVAVSPKVRRYLTRCCSALNIYQSLCHSWRYPARHCRTNKNPGRPVFDEDSLSFVCVSSGLSRHDGSVSHVSSGRGVPHSGKPSGHAGKATDGR